ncbi:MAG: UDP-N-acetylmuramoyl-tripeptide--D-alanyl-D-alanine ligase [Burkholderiales bacterium]|nr:UDP-N-acetylmuramoyl-tripeptide--D-alanyl-D-alanine ligase [Burkholderiales bacterium]
MMDLAEAARAIGARAEGAARFAGVSTDSRTVRAGELFVAIRGERHDGHAFVAAAAARGAAAAMVDERALARGAGPAPLPRLVVEDTRAALGRLAAHWRRRFSPTLVAIAGSNGKTTTKEMLAAILRAHAGEAAVLATAGNLNTDIGVALTLLRLRPEHRYGAIEIGMNHPGEVAPLAAIVAPAIALVTNAQREHMEFMKSVEACARENAAVYAALAADGIAVVNADDAHAAVFFAAAAGRRIVRFGLAAPAEVRAEFSLGALASEIALRTPAGEARATLAIPGLHNVRNALAAAACAFAAGVAPAAIAAGLAAFRPAPGRLAIRRLASGAILVDDSYNANPDSVRAAIDVLAALPSPQLLVLGDMGETGEFAPAFHREVGAYAKRRGIARLAALGTASRAAVEAFGAGGAHFEDLEALARSAEGAAAVLVKGSRFMRMERVVALLAGEPATEGAH